MKIPETAGCEPARPPSQMAAIPLSPPSNKKQSYLPSDKHKEEVDDVNDTFKKLIISPNIDEKSTNSIGKALETDRINYRNLGQIDSHSESGSSTGSNYVGQIDSHSESGSSTDSDSDDDLVAKCPERESKKNRQHRQQNGPYTGHFSNRNHHCGGVVTCNNNYDNNDYNYQIPNNLDQENDCSDVSAVDEVLNIIIEEHWPSIEAVINIINNGPNSIVDESETVISEDVVTVSRNDDDSAYETSSPNSSISFSPMPNPRFSDVEGSPLHENETVINTFNPEFEGQNSNQNIFKTPSSTGKKERTQPVYIPSGRPLINRSPIDRQYPSTSKSVPTSPVQQRKHCPPSIAITPEAPVYESTMIQLGAERLKLILNQRRLGIEWIIVLQDDRFTSLDSESNQTKLMLHLRNRSRPFYNEVFHAMLERIKKEQLFEILCHESSIGESALSIAVNELPDNPIIARCIVDALTSMGHSVDQVDRNGNSLIHKLASYGDRYVQVLAELLNARRENNSPYKCFDVNKQNIMQETPLHISTKKHSPQFSTLAVTKLLVKHNADISTQDFDGRTPVHLAVKHSSDPLLLKALLASNYTNSASVSVDHLGDTALHYAGARNDLDLNPQLDIMNQLVRSQWKLNAVNSDNKTPLAYLSEQRRKTIKDHLTKK